MGKNRKSVLQIFKGRKQKTNYVNVVEVPAERHGGVVKISLDWQYDEFGDRSVAFKKYEPRGHSKQTVNIFIAGGASVDRAVQEANTKCLSVKSAEIP